MNKFVLLSLSFCINYYYLSVINFSDDNDGVEDVLREKTGARITLKEGMTKSWTICLAYMVEAWSGEFMRAHLFTIRNSQQKDYATLVMSSENGQTRFTGRIGNIKLDLYHNSILFPHTWTRICLSYNDTSGNVALVVNGHVLVDKVYPEWFDCDWRCQMSKPQLFLWLYMGYEGDAEGGTTNEDKPSEGVHRTSVEDQEKQKSVWESAGMVSQFNIFQSPLATDLMVNRTLGGEECGVPGDLVDWEKDIFQLTSKARMEMINIDVVAGPCTPPTEVVVYTADFQSQTGCMEHCEKLGEGRSPPVRNLEEWDWLREEVLAITPDVSVLPKVWLPVTDNNVEGEWRDSYPPYDRVDTNVTDAWPWRSSLKDAFGQSGDNCMQWETNYALEASWSEVNCLSYSIACLIGCVIK